MSPRREPWSVGAGTDAIAQLESGDRLILPALQAISARFGYVPREAVRLVADELNVSVAEVHGVLTFYHDLRTSPPAPVRVDVCAAEACQACGAASLVEHLASTIAPVGRRSADGLVDVREVFCLGNCALGPSVAVDGRVLGRVTPARLHAAVDAAVGAAVGAAVADEVAAAPAGAP